MNTKNICIIAPSRQMGGIERALSILSAHFVKRGHKVTYISCRAGNHFYELDSKVVYLEPPFPHSVQRFSLENDAGNFYRSKQIERIVT